MVEVIQSDTFAKWLTKLKDQRARAKVLVRIDRLAHGNPGDVEPVGKGISEMRIDYGPGYRVYFKQRGPVIVVLLCAGTKDTQQQDIDRAKQIADEWRD